MAGGAWAERAVGQLGKRSFFASRPAGAKISGEATANAAAAIDIDPPGAIILVNAVTNYAKGLGRNRGMSASILIIDDDFDFCTATGAALEAAGFRVRTAANAKEGRAAIAAERPDLIILDVMMSWALEGLRLSLELKRSSVTRFIPIVMVSSITSSEYAAAFPADQPLHVDEFISKPVQSDHLVRRVQKLLAARVGV